MHSPADRITACLQLLFLAALVALFAWLNLGCSPRAAQRVLSATSHAVVEVDRTTAEVYAERRVVCRDASASWAEYDACMEAANAVEEGLRAATRGLHAGQAAVDAWRHGGEEDWPELAACIASALSQILDGARALEIEIPRLVNRAISLAAAFGGTCRNPDGASSGGETSSKGLDPPAPARALGGVS